MPRADRERDSIAQLRPEVNARRIQKLKWRKLSDDHKLHISQGGKKQFDAH